MIGYVTVKQVGENYHVVHHVYQFPKGDLSLVNREERLESTHPESKAAYLAAERFARSQDLYWIPPNTTFLLVAPKGRDFGLVEVTAGNHPQMHQTFKNWNAACRTGRMEATSKKMMLMTAKSLFTPAGAGGYVLE